MPKMKISQNESFFSSRGGESNWTHESNFLGECHRDTMRRRKAGDIDGLVRKADPKKLPPKKCTVLNRNTAKCISDSDFVGSFGRI